ncbi:hypothetical protein [Alteromonas gracilis]|uniref:Uncharacterized protein n=1 Tax=Alteromonas gracilis TaxID=1479524 RepID=A0ABX5CSR5_9ALTE|nr:hypothetical protein [Alteromonas gracilis]PRO70423.1 hypothetical protein C6Y39_02155 [Alteromonas gracilis]
MTDTLTSVHFRLTKLDAMQAYTLKREIEGAYFIKRDDTDVFVGMVPLKETLFDELNDYVIRQQIQYDACDILVEAKNTTGEVAVPRVVNKLLKYIDCKLTYTCSA